MGRDEAHHSPKVLAATELGASRLGASQLVQMPSETDSDPAQRAERCLGARFSKQGRMWRRHGGSVQDARRGLAPTECLRCEALWRVCRSERRLCYVPGTLKPVVGVATFLLRGRPELGEEQPARRHRATAVECIAAAHIGRRRVMSHGAAGVQLSAIALDHRAAAALPESS